MNVAIDVVIHLQHDPMMQVVLEDEMQGSCACIVTVLSAVSIEHQGVMGWFGLEGMGVDVVLDTFIRMFVKMFDMKDTPIHVLAWLEGSLHLIWLGMSTMMHTFQVQDVMHDPHFGLEDVCCIDHSLWLQILKHHVRFVHVFNGQHSHLGFHLGLEHFHSHSHSQLHRRFCIEDVLVQSGFEIFAIARCFGWAAVEFVHVLA